MKQRNRKRRMRGREIERKKEKKKEEREKEGDRGYLYFLITSYYLALFLSSISFSLSHFFVYFFLEKKERKKEGERKSLLLMEGEGEKTLPVKRIHFFHHQSEWVERWGKIQ